MSVLLDTRDVAPGDRADALREAMRHVGIHAEVTPYTPSPLVRMEAWDLGAGCTLMRRTSSGLRLVRSAQHTRTDGPARVTLTLLSPGAWGYEHDGVQEGGSLAQPELVLVDQLAPYEFHRQASGRTIAVTLPADLTGLPRRCLPTASLALNRDPALYTLLRHHLRDIAALAAHRPDLVSSVAPATTSLVRALLATAADEPALRALTTTETLHLRSQAFIRSNLADPALTPAVVAAAHHVSIRQLYNAWNHEEQGIAEWIITERLHRAANLLRDRDGAARTVAWVAHSTGFVSAAHFTQRFRAKYGMTPREFRASHGEDRWPEPT